MSIGSVNVPGSIGVGIKSNLNLFRNAYWANKEAIINQRGKSEYTEDGYGLDGWVTLGAIVTILDNGVRIASKSGQRAFFSQLIEGYELLGHQVTCSIFCKDGTLFFWTIDLTSPTPFPQSNTMIYHDWSGRIELEVWIMPDRKSILFQFTLAETENATEEILALKNELGPISTLAHKDAAGNWVLNDPPPDPALELLKCQRYLQRMTFYAPITARFGNTVIAVMDLQIPMRTNPTILNPEVLGIYDYGGNYIGGTINTFYTTVQNGLFSVSLDVPDGQDAMAYGNTIRSNTNYVFVSSEL